MSTRNRQKLNECVGVSSLSIVTDQEQNCGVLIGHLKKGNNKKNLVGLGLTVFLFSENQNNVLNSEKLGKQK